MSYSGTCTIIDDLENGRYFKPEFYNNLGSEIKLKIEKFSYWFSSTARLYLLRCDRENSEILVYLLLNLREQIESAISDINKSASNHSRAFTCNLCEQVTAVEPWQDTWSALQEDPHLEEIYSQFDTSMVENDEFSTSGSSEDLSQTVPANPESKLQPEGGLNDFKFNFVVTYDQRVEEFLYPESLMTVARKVDNVPEHTIQRSGPGRGACLLCPCPLLSKGRAYKINRFTIKNHVLGQRHLKCASSPANLEALQHYHEFWRKQEPNYQSHQIHFLPELGEISCNRCFLCVEIVPYLSTVDHIKDKTHKANVLQIFNSLDGKRYEFYLIEMQVDVYNIGTTAVAKKEKQQDNKENGPVAPPKCVFVKFEPGQQTINLPSRYKDHLSVMCLMSADLVRCHVCKMNLSNSPEVLRHVISSQHKQLSNITSPKYGFFCEICNLHVKDENAWIEHFVKGPNRHNNMPPIRQEKVAEYECKTCMLVIFGDELSLSRHISRGGKAGRAKEVKLPFTVKKLFKSKALIEEEGRKLRKEANQVFAEKDALDECCEDLEEAVGVAYPMCKAYAFGSRISGLGNDQSDLDVFLDLGEMYVGVKHQDCQSQEQFVKKATKMLKAWDDFTNVFPIPSARTPIVKLRHKYTKLDCDVSFRHGLGVENTKFLRFCIDLQDITQPFILLLKKWSDNCKLNEHITNYALALMAVFFLQTGGYLLPVKTVRNYNPTQSLVIDGWETITYTIPMKRMRELVKPCKLTLRELLRDFFGYFSKFDYANNVVCPLLGRTIPKLLFNEKPDENLPVEMKSYVQRIQSENGEQFRGLTPFCIQDPFDLSHNLTKACQQGTISRLKTLCTLTREFLETIE